MGNGNCCGCYFTSANKLSGPFPEKLYYFDFVLCFWTHEEKDIFKDKYLQRPKDFGYISSFLKRKSTQDCIQYYYLPKRKENYKQMVKKQKAFRMRRGPNKNQYDDGDVVIRSLSIDAAIEAEIAKNEQKIKAIVEDLACVWDVSETRGLPPFQHSLKKILEDLVRKQT
ncbi:uncharacterized protein LOC129589067 [Paramacrobiotus metropolitanus]|uniref:uncharacterized protein LOC129589067 n=1 Tax=Paramacrobiotus metropolitanus TaxID=2943436 RepID=UPI0024463B91|nr:uncharacterized protein LOC129589067 [Paramacrobiotus metropolitanus]XP_055339527.1 uncharacterized protein LOC129589067 [Paramacrobiotus metropolitanus]